MMGVSRTMLALTLAVVVSACVYQSVQGKAADNDIMQDFKKSFDLLAQKASVNPSFINPFRLIARILSFVLFPARFIIRFITTIIAVVALSLAGCQIFPTVSCGFPIREKIPELLSDIQQEFDYYLGLAETEEN